MMSTSPVDATFTAKLSLVETRLRQQQTLRIVPALARTGLPEFAITQVAKSWLKPSNQCVPPSAFAQMQRDLQEDE